MFAQHLGTTTNAAACFTRRQLPALVRMATSPDDEDIDYLVLYGDSGVLLAFGSVQAVFDSALQPLYSTLIPDSAVAVVSHAPLQGMLLCAHCLSNPGLALPYHPAHQSHVRSLVCDSAACWVGILLAMKAYRPSVTRALMQPSGFLPLLAAWLGSSLALVAALVAVGVPLDAESDFLLGSITVVGGWRYLYSQGLPLP